MAKNNSLFTFAPLGVAALALLATLTIFFPAIGISENSTYTGLQIAFGFSETVSSSVTITVFNFSFLCLLAYLLPLGAVVFSVLGYLNKNKLFTLIASVLAVVGGVFLFLLASTASFNEDAKSLFSIFGAKITFNLLAFPIIAGILSCLGGALGICGSVMKK